MRACARCWAAALHGRVPARGKCEGDSGLTRLGKAARARGKGSGGTATPGCWRNAGAVRLQRVGAYAPEVSPRKHWLEEDYFVHVERDKTDAEEVAGREDAHHTVDLLAAADDTARTRRPP